MKAGLFIYTNLVQSLAEVMPMVALIPEHVDPLQWEKDRRELRTGTKVGEGEDVRSQDFS